MFVHVTSTRKGGELVEHLLAVDQIATVAAHKGHAIITVKNSEFDIWTVQTFEEVTAMIQDALEDL